ncbi:hypothetical protein BDV19DRAFT_20987 [Aspergillus venezuelensis]
MPKGMHNPLPASLGSECKKATQILDSFINGSWRGSPGRELPERVLRDAKGLAILTITKAGILGSLRFGSGILISRLPDTQDPQTGAISQGGWSPPSAISTIGLGFGGQAGFELTDFVFLFNDSTSLAAFSRLGSLTLSGNFSIAFGPLGRNAEIAGGFNVQGAGSMRSFAKTKGLFGGVSVESGVLVERRWANRRFFGKRVTPGEILEGSVDVPDSGREAVEGLMRVLGEVFARGGSESGNGGLSATGDAEAVEAAISPAPTAEASALPVTEPPTGPGRATVDALVNGNEHLEDRDRDASTAPAPGSASTPAPESAHALTPDSQEAEPTTRQEPEAPTIAAPKTEPEANHATGDEHRHPEAVDTANTSTRQAGPASG